MRRNIVAGNWKSNETFNQADDLINDIAEGLRAFDSTDVDVIVCPPFPYLELVQDAAEDVEFLSVLKTYPSSITEPIPVKYLHKCCKA